jgi:hypothetical protein
VTHGDLKPQTIAPHGLETLFPESRSTPVAATGGSQDGQLFGRRKDCLSLALPQAGDGIDREGCRVGRGTSVDGATVLEHVVDVDGDRLRAPAPLRLLEVANQLLFLVSALMIG